MWGVLEREDVVVTDAARESVKKDNKQQPMSINEYLEEVQHDTQSTPEPKKGIKNCTYTIK